MLPLSATLPSISSASTRFFGHPKLIKATFFDFILFIFYPFLGSCVPSGHPILPGTGIPLWPDSPCILQQHRPQPSGQSTLQRANNQSPIVSVRGRQTPFVSPARFSLLHYKGCLWQYSLVLKFLSRFSTRS